MGDLDELSVTQSKFTRRPNWRERLTHLGAGPNQHGAMGKVQMQTQNPAGGKGWGPVSRLARRTGPGGVVGSNRT